MKQNNFGVFFSDCNFDIVQGCVNGNIDGMGRVIYEYNGECFFLFFGFDDVVDSSFNLKSGDKVFFFMVIDKRFVCIIIILSVIFVKMFYVKFEICFYFVVLQLNVLI